MSGSFNAFFPSVTAFWSCITEFTSAVQYLMKTINWNTIPLTSHWTIHNPTKWRNFNKIIINFSKKLQKTNFVYSKLYNKTPFHDTPMTEPIMTSFWNKHYIKLKEIEEWHWLKEMAFALILHQTLSNI